tara:strand:- start:403 stop:585 length:183 start_codon:yes stop_codon:yes gene_type:complete
MSDIITTSEELIIFNNLVADKIQSLKEFKTLQLEWFIYCDCLKSTNTKPLSLMDYYELSI